MSSKRFCTIVSFCDFYLTDFQALSDRLLRHQRTVDIFDDPRPISASLADCCDVIIVSTRVSLLNYFGQIATNVAPLVSRDSSSYICSFPYVFAGNISFQIFHSYSRQLVFDATTFKRPQSTFDIYPSFASTSGGVFVKIFNLSHSWVPIQCVFGTLLADYICSGDSCGCIVPQSWKCVFGFQVF